ncbi:MAG: dihydrolipoamide acetyltransferase family protein [Fimbriimonadaceae bacterium]|nr:dihydrolipoamide acetyltransferase family protein [Fimbriimonadaceae bacterium]
MTEVIMPKMGDGMEEGTLVEWLKKDGDSVKSGEVIGSIQTDKATLELEAPGTGVLTGILLEAGGTVPVGKPIAAILKPGETLPAGWGGASAAPAPAAIAASDSVATPTASAVTPAAEVAPVAVLDARVKASPLARRIAEQNAVDLTAISGTGPNGRIVQADVLSAIGQASTTEVAAPAAPAPSSAPIVASAEDQVIKLPRLRQITAKRTTESKQQVPHFYVTVEVDVERIMALREMFESEESGKVSVNDFVIKASALALRDMPEVNAVYQGDQVTIHGGVHVGMAVAIADGLTVPVIHNADQLSLRAISARARELAKKARDNKLSLHELTGSTFSISNMGMLDVDNFLAIINQPNSAIVAIASARKKVVVNDQDEIEVRQRMNITGSFDHRALDGAVGAKFINLIKTYLENPTRLLS